MNPMNKLPAVQIVIANWNDEQTTRKCLEHIQKLDYSNYYVTVVDSGSSDGSGERIKENFPWVRLIHVQENYGHTHAANVGAMFTAKEESQYILFLDNDAYLAPSCLTSLIQSIDANPKYGMACPLIFSENKSGTIWYGGGRITIFGNAHHENMGKIANIDILQTKVVEYASSCVLLIRREIFNQVSGFDEKLFNYSEDLDLSWKVRLLGYDLIFVPTANAIHGESKNVIKVAGKVFRDYYTMRNRLYMIRKYGNIFQKSVGVLFSILWYAGGFGVIHLLRGEWKRTQSLLRGVIDFFKGKYWKWDL
ncbi:MAG: glycosyltransferase family 2 protein [Bacteroidota bacterium]|nr:glycosyltransferase family 2 protein [Bacteroidota bacterium]